MGGVGGGGGGGKGRGGGLGTPAEEIGMDPHLAPPLGKGFTNICFKSDKQFFHRKAFIIVHLHS